MDLLHTCKKMSISKILQKQVWEKEFSAYISGKCVICDTSWNIYFGDESKKDQ